MPRGKRISPADMERRRRFLQKLHIKVGKVRYPPPIETIKSRWRALRDTYGIVPRSIHLLKVSPRHYDNIKPLKALGISPQAYPDLLTLPSKTLAQRIQFLKSEDINFKTQPRLLSIPPKTLTQKMQSLKKIGISPQAYLSLLTMFPDTLAQRLQSLQKLGINFKTHPRIPTMSPTTLSRRISLFGQLGCPYKKFAHLLIYPIEKSQKTFSSKRYTPALSAISSGNKEAIISKFTKILRVNPGKWLGMEDLHSEALQDLLSEAQTAAWEIIEKTKNPAANPHVFLGLLFSAANHKFREIRSESGKLVHAEDWQIEKEARRRRKEEE